MVRAYKSVYFQRKVPEHHSLLFKNNFLRDCVRILSKSHWSVWDCRLHLPICLDICLSALLDLCVHFSRAIWLSFFYSYTKWKTVKMIVPLTCFAQISSSIIIHLTSTYTTPILYGFLSDYRIPFRLGRHVLKQGNDQGRGCDHYCSECECITPTVPIVKHDRMSSLRLLTCRLDR